MVERDASRELTFDPSLPPLDHVPVVVNVDRDLGTYVPAFRDAIAVWNREAGCQLFRVSVPGEYPNAVVGWSEWTACTGGLVLEDKHAAASTFFCIDGTTEIRVHQLSDVSTATVIFLHELGHVLRLGHDQGGLMAKELVGLPSIPSLADRRAVKKRYCR